MRFLETARAPPPKLAARGPRRRRTRLKRSSSISREDDLGAQCRRRGEVEAALELVADERAHDREAGARPASPSTPAPVVGDREHDVAVPARELDRAPAPPPCSSAFWSSSLKTSASAVARLPASETGSSARLDRLARRRAPARASRAAGRAARASSTSSSRCSVSTSCTAAIARMRFTECSSASRGSTSSARAPAAAAATRPSAGCS